MSRLALVLLLIFSVTPMASEMVELAVHAIRHGDLAHAEGHEQAGSPGNDDHDEHGCSSLFHMCGCHSNAPSTPAVSRVWRPGKLPVAQGLRSIGPSTSDGRGAEAPPIRPPIA